MKALRRPAYSRCAEKLLEFRLKSAVFFESDRQELGPAFPVLLNRRFLLWPQPSAPDGSPHDRSVPCHHRGLAYYPFVGPVVCSPLDGELLEDRSPAHVVLYPESRPQGKRSVVAVSNEGIKECDFESPPSSA